MQKLVNHYTRCKFLLSVDNKSFGKAAESAQLDITRHGIVNNNFFLCVLNKMPKDRLVISQSPHGSTVNRKWAATYKRVTYRDILLQKLVVGHHIRLNFMIDIYTLTVNFGTSQMRWSSVTVPTMTAIRPSRPGFFINLTTLAREIGGLLILDIKRRLRITLLNFESVRRAKNLYSWKNIQTSCITNTVLSYLESHLQNHFNSLYYFWYNQNKSSDKYENSFSFSCYILLFYFYCYHILFLIVTFSILSIVSTIAYIIFIGLSQESIKLKKLLFYLH